METITQKIQQLLRANLDEKTLRSELFLLIEDHTATARLDTTNPLELDDENISFETFPFPVEQLQQEIAKEHQANYPSTTEHKYEYLSELGKGGMGEVQKVKDLSLNRILAMKIIHPNLLKDFVAVEHFIEEGQICAQLQHPNIVPVHELGRLEDGRVYFTMKEIRGQSLKKAIKSLHSSSENRWSFRYLIDAFRQTCQAISYAHSKGVLHRDLKPSNVMLGEYGEVLVLDWGIAIIFSSPENENKENNVQTRSALNTAHQDFGEIIGTPHYMSPEQAQGKILDQRSDIYSLGAILYEILTGKPPYFGSTAMQALKQVKHSAPTPIQYLYRTNNNVDTFHFIDDFVPSPSHTKDIPKEPPSELVKACERAMSRDITQRYPSVEDFTKVIVDWLDGVQKEDQALEIMREALNLEKTRNEMLEKADSLLQTAHSGLENIPSWQTEDIKGKWWALEKEAMALCTQAELLQTVQEQKLQGALTHKSNLEEVHVELAKRYQRQHRKLEENSEHHEAKKIELRLTEHTNALSTHNQYKAPLLSYLKGTGAFSMTTDTDNVSVCLEKFEPLHRRLIAKPIAYLGQAPIIEYKLEMGSYQVRLKKDGFHDVVYPFVIGRGEHWDCRDPHGNIQPIHLPKQGSLFPNECFIPGGWFWAGGDPNLALCLPKKRVWIDNLIVQRFPVTIREYLYFLNDLVTQNREEEALLYAPKERGVQEGLSGDILFPRNKHGEFYVSSDGYGDVWHVDWPIMMVDWFCANAYSEWLAIRRQQPYRLLYDMEWEKAARGVDGRFFPWGNDFDPSYACIKTSHKEDILPQIVDSFPIDESVYGVRGMAGNIRDWTITPVANSWETHPDISLLQNNRAIHKGSDQYLALLHRSRKSNSNKHFYYSRGGFCIGEKHRSRLADRATNTIGLLDGAIGFRVCRPYRQ